MRRCHLAGGFTESWNLDGRHMRSPERLGLVVKKRGKWGGEWHLTEAGKQVAEVIA